ncbi:MAG: polymer-forming cytoskeletal protein [bacterium]|nr:polymer-forming cytoskeletal protein [bacterium]
MSNILRRLGAEGAGSGIPNYPAREEGQKMVIQDKLQQPISHGELKETVISPDAEFKGALKFKDSLRIDGGFDGEIDSQGTLFVGKTGLVKAEIHVGNIVVEGKVEGNVTCDDKVELRSTAKMFGDIQAARLTIAEGVSIVGKCSVTSQRQAEAARTDRGPRPDFRKGKEEKPAERPGASVPSE